MVSSSPSTPLPSAPGLTPKAQSEAYDALVIGISSLAQELQDEILDWTLLAKLPPKQALVDVPIPSLSDMGMFSLALTEPTKSGINVIHIDLPTYSHPIGLYINSVSRKRFASSYYANSVFYVKEHDLAKCHDWLRSTPAEHRKTITTIRYGDCDLGKWFDLLEPSDIVRRIQDMTLEINTDGNALQPQGAQASLMMEPRQLVVLMAYENSDPNLPFLRRGWWRGDGVEITEL